MTSLKQDHTRLVKLHMAMVSIVTQINLTDSFIKQTMTTWRRTDIVWKLKSCPVKTRFLYWNAVIKTKLMYGLYLIALTQAQQRRKNAIPNKGYRKILGLKTTYIDRRNSVEFIFQRANALVRTETAQEHRARAEARKAANHELCLIHLYSGS